jgi:peptidoglycan/LPS O-acetylase OafA/YrhL
MAERKLEWLEAMRGLAALWVVMHHAGQSVDHFVGSTGDRPFIARGFLGVDFFFVLSGFIIAFASHRLFERGGGVREYFTARLVRIYVPYLPIGIAMWLLYALLPSLSEGGRDVSVLTSLTLLPDNLPPALSVAWTLVHEMLFYAIYALWFVHRVMFRAVLTAWAIAIVVFAVAGTELPRAAMYLLSPLNLCFVTGVLVFHLSRRNSLAPAMSVTIGVCGLVLLVSQVVAVMPNRVLIGVAFALLVLAATSSFAARFSIWRPFVALGAASYAVYLVHNPALSFLVRVIKVALPGIGVWPAFALIACIATGMGMAYWRWYERPTLAWVRARVMPARDVESLRET